MAHITVRHRQTRQGLKWTATEAVWNGDKDTCTERKIEGLALQSLGFSENMTPVQAKVHAKKLNRLTAIKRKEQAIQIKAAERLTDLITVANSIVPEAMSTAFVSHLEQNWYGGQYNLRKLIQHWNLIQTVITKLNIQPHEYFKRQRDIYKYFQKQKYSKSYVEKLIKVLNLWGEYYSEESRTFYKKLPNPKGIALEAIVDSSDADGKGAEPLTVDLLSKLKFKLPTGQWEYLRATLWLGLRPSELDLLLSDATKYKVSMQGSTSVLHVYQSKLTGIAKDRRWKVIPLFHTEMLAALNDIQSKLIKKPILKTIKKAAPKIKGLGLYSGRKGFTDLMLSLEQTLENIAMWMGHASIERTWKHYKNKDVVNFKPLQYKI